MDDVAIITGSSGGVGSALVRSYVSGGYSVIGIDKVQPPVTSAGVTGLDIDLYKFAKIEEYRNLQLKRIDQLLPKNIGRLVLINNAAVQILNPVDTIAWADWDESLVINTIAPFFLVMGMSEQLMKANGSVINISSIHAKLTKENFTCYAVSKAALEAVTRSLAVELSASGIRVNAVAPAALMTEMLKEGFRATPEKLKELRSYHPSNSIGSPSEIGSFIKSLTDLDGQFLTGSIIDFNGGIGSRLHDPD